MDIPRTFAQRNFSPIKKSDENGQNPLYNVLVCVARHFPEIAYCQGMNFLGGLVLIGSDYDEVVAFAILDKLLGEYGELGSLYTGELAKLFALSDSIYSWMLTEEPILEEIISENGVPLTTLLAGPLMAVFSNILEAETCLVVVDRMILLKEDALLDIIKQVFRAMRDDIIMTFGNPKQKKTL